MKPLYDRYRLVKQILCRASTIPVIVSIPPFTSSSSTSSSPPLSTFSLRHCPVVLLLSDSTLSERLQTLNPQLTLALVPAVGTGGSRATDVLSTFQGSKSGFSSSVNRPGRKGAHRWQIEFTGSDITNSSVQDGVRNCRNASV